MALFTCCKKQHIGDTFDSYLGDPNKLRVQRAWRIERMLWKERIRMDG
jgi:hypothetical protein